MFAKLRQLVEADHSASGQRVLCTQLDLLARRKRRRTRRCCLEELNARLHAYRRNSYTAVP